MRKEADTCQTCRGIFHPSIRRTTAAAVRARQESGFSRCPLSGWDFTCCEGCSLQILNCEDDMPELVAAVDIVNFREAMAERSDYYDIAFIDGACSREAEIEALKEIRQRAKMVVPIGACACLGGVNCLKNSYPMDELLRSEYGQYSPNFNTIPARPVSAVIPIDFFIPGCPIVKEEFLRVVAGTAYRQNTLSAG